MDTEEYKKNIEKQVLDIIEERLKSGEMNSERARDIARFVLDALKPHMNFDEIFQTVQTFDDNFPELINVVTPIIKDYEDKIKQIVLSQVDILLKENKIGEANQLLNKALNKQIKVE